MRQQNVKTIHFLAVSVLTGILLIRFSAIFIDYTHMVNYHLRYRSVSNYFIITSILFAGSLTLIRKYVPYQRLHKYNWVAFLYAASFIGGNIWFSFLAQNNPKNTITMLMMALLLIAAMMVLSLLETILLIVPCVVVFTFGLAHFQTNPEQWVANYVVFCFVVSGFFMLSRLLYSYHVNSYIKVKTIEENTLEIKHANEAKNEILSVVAHDLRSPISNIQSLVEMIQNYELSEEERTDYLARIVECCVKANTTIRDIITAAREDKMGEMAVSEECLNQCLQEICTGWKKIINGKRELQLVLPREKIFAGINKDKFNRIMDNLISNAIKFTTEETGNIRVELQAAGNMARIMVKDNGIGIPPDQVPHLFEKFTSASRAGLNNEVSVGLGLNISKQLVEKHRGRIYVESRENDGASFYIELPVSGASER